MAIQWSEKMTTGFKEIDDEHKGLIASINTFSELVKNGSGKQDILNMLQYLKEYAEVHFLHEENCMNSNKCPAAEANRKAHGEFLYFVLLMKEDVEKNGPSLASVIELNNSLGDWLQTHIMGVDSSLKSCSKNSNQYNLN